MATRVVGWRLHKDMRAKSYREGHNVMEVEREGDVLDIRGSRLRGKLSPWQQTRIFNMR